MPSEVFYIMPGTFDLKFPPSCFWEQRIFMQLFSVLSASQLQASPSDDSIRPSLGDTPTDLNILLLGEAIDLRFCTVCRIFS